MAPKPSRSARSVRAIVMGPRGRVVLPASMRRMLRLEPGDQLVVEVEDDHSVRLTPRRVLAERDRGVFADLKTAESLVDELIAERRAEAAREDPDREAEP